MSSDSANSPRLRKAEQGRVVQSAVRKKLDIIQHPAIVAVRRALQGTSFEGDVFIVGGAVRDELLSLGSGADLDLVTQQSSAELARHLYRVGVSQLAPIEYSNFGTAMVRVQALDIEIVTSRADSYRDGSRKPSVVAACYIEDAERRDFTINTLACDLFTGELVDRLGTGVADIAERRLRTHLIRWKRFVKTRYES